MLSIFRLQALFSGLALIAAIATSSIAYAKPEGGSFSGGPKTIASKERVSVLIDREVEETKSFIVLKISVPTDSKINAFLLPDPPRLVVDFEGATIKKSENFPAPTNGVIKQVRLGAHAEKLRVVVDFISSKTPEYEWKAGKRQVILRILESTHEAPAAPAQPQIPPAAQPTAVEPPPAQPTTAPTIAPTVAATRTPALTATAATTPPPVNSATPTTTSTPTEVPTEKPTLQEVEKQNAAAAGVAAGAVAPAGAPQKAALPASEGEGLEAASQPASVDLGDMEEQEGPPPTPKGPSAFTIKGYRFEYLPDKTPVLKILLNKPRAQTQISKIDAETYSILIKDCGLENEELELPQFPPHDFVGFVMVVAEDVGKDVEISVSTEEGMVLGTSMHESEIWVKKP